MEGLGTGAGAGMAFDIASREGGAATVLTISGELDVANIERLERAMAPVLSTRPRRLVIDVGRLRFADSSAIALWVRWASVVDTLELRHPTPLLQRIISSMGLGEKFGLGT